MTTIPQKHEAKKTKYQHQLEQIITHLEEHGDLFVVSKKGHGKTVACQNLAMELTTSPNNKLIVFETFPKWSLEFPNASFMEIPSNWIVESDKVINIENAWIQHERSFTVLHGDLIKQFLKQNKHCIFLISNQDIEKIAFFCYSVIYRYYRRQYDLLRKGYELTRNFYFVLEEAQNSLSRQVLSRKLFNRYRKLFSEARNMGLHWILISQRMQDLSTYFRARCSLAIGKIGLDDYDLKLRRLLKPVGNQERILKLDRGSFYFTAINDIVKFPTFQPCKPNEFKIEPQPEPKPKTLWQKIKNAFKQNEETGSYVIEEEPDLDEDSDEWEEGEGYPIFDEEFI